MAKKLKKKIEEVCGLKELDWEARQDKALKILASTEWKQRICNELIGLSFRELEQALTGFASERQKKEESYERKLEAYRSGKTSHRPGALRGSDDKPKPVPKALPPRTLRQILEQVYARRENSEISRKEEITAFMAQIRTERALRSEEILSDSFDGDDSAIE